MALRGFFAVFALLAALVVLTRAESPICPLFVAGPWYQANVTIAPFRWCKAGDIGRVPTGLEGFGLPPTWVMGSSLNCNDGLCKGVLQVELVSSIDSGGDSELFGLYAADASVLIVSDLSNLSNHDIATLNFGIGPIYTFRLVMDAESRVKAVILNTGHKDGVTGWYFHWIGRNAFGMPSLSGSLLNLTQSFQARTAIIDVNYYYDSHGLALMIASKDQIQFARLSYASSFPSSFAHVWISTQNNPDGLSQRAIALRTFIQPGKTTLTSRQLIAVFGYNVVHVIAPPPQTPEIASYTIEWFNPSARSVILKTPSNTRLFHVEFFPEQGIRTGQDKPYMWLAYVTDTYTTGETAVRSNLTLVQLPEFAHWEPETAPLAASIDLSAESALAAVSVSNPLGLSNPPCAWNAMMNTSSESPCSTPRVTKQLHSRIGRGIKQIAVRNIPAVSWIGDFVPPYCKLGNCSTPAMTVIFGVENSTLTVFALDPTLDTTYDARSEQINYFNMSGLAHRMAVPQNGLHVILPVDRYLWEINSRIRYNLLCQAIETRHNFTSLELELIEPWRAYCWGLNLTLSIGDFLQYVSLCPFGSVCSSSTTYALGKIDLGSYSPYPISTAHCEPGFICPLGFSSPCPVGHICSSPKQLFPTPCPADSVAKGTSCWAEGLTAPIPAPDGFVPIYAHGPPLPAPPGHYSYYSKDEHAFTWDRLSSSGLGGQAHFGVGRSRRALPNLSHASLTIESDRLGSLDYNNGLAQFIIQLAECPDGQYCPIGSHSHENRSCPVGHYCPNSSVLFPTPCKSPNYCPEGSPTEQLCPAGYFCVDPSTSEKCLRGFYCFAGSLSQEICRAGYFCSDPSKEEICPVGSFCPEGSIAPSKCSFLSCLSEGTHANRPFWAIPILGVLSLLFLGWHLQPFLQLRLRCSRCRRRCQAPWAHSYDGPIPDGITMDDDIPTGCSPDVKPPPPSLTTNAKPNAGLTVYLENVTLMLDGLKVLDNVSVSFRPGTITVLVGASRGGKTPIFHVIAGNYLGELFGSVWIAAAGTRIMRPIDVAQRIAFVPDAVCQDDDLTVEEHLALHANLRPSDSPITVDSLLEELGLRDRRHFQCVKLTKGERLLLSIGTELISNPLVLLVDEPNDLDAAASDRAYDLLRRAADRGCTVVCAVQHSGTPLLDNSDNLLLLHRGRRVYMGERVNAVAFAKIIDERKTKDPDAETPTGPAVARFLIDVASAVTHSPPRKQIPIPNELTIPVPRPAPWSEQFKGFFGRSCIKQFRDWKKVFGLCVLSVILGLAVGFSCTSHHYSGPVDPRACISIPVDSLRRRCYKPEKDPIGFQALKVTFFIGLYAALFSACSHAWDREYLWKVSSFSSSTPYLWGTDLSHLPRDIILPAIFSLCYSFLMPRLGFGMLYAICLSAWWCASGLGLLFSTALPLKPAVATTLVFVAGLGLFSSAIVELPVLYKIPVLGLFPYASFLRWLVEAYYLAEMKEWEKVYGDQVYQELKYLGYERDRFSMDFLIPLAMGLIARVLATFLIAMVNRRERRRRRLGEGLLSSFLKLFGWNPGTRPWQAGAYDDVAAEATEETHLLPDTMDSRPSSPSGTEVAEGAVMDSSLSSSSSIAIPSKSKVKSVIQSAPPTLSPLPPSPKTYDSLSVTYPPRGFGAQTDVPSYVPLDLDGEEATVAYDHRNSIE